MKATTLLSTLITTSLLVAAPVPAGPWDGHPDMASSILNDLDRPAYVGTGLSEARPRVKIYPSAYTSDDLDTSGFVIGTAGPEKGAGDTYGSVLHDIGR